MRRSACGRYCRRFTLALGSTCTRGSLERALRRAEKTPLSDQPDVTSAEPETATLVASYEALRRIALGPRGPDDGPSLGLAILLRHGVAAWLRAWARCPSPADPVPTPHRRSRFRPRPHGARAARAHGARTSGGRMDLTGERSQKITPRHLRRQAISMCGNRRCGRSSKTPRARTATPSANARWRWAGRSSRSS